MAPSDIALVITACGSSAAAVISAYGVIVSQRNNRKLDAVHTLTQEVKTETDGMKDELVKSVREASFAQGVKSEVDRNGARSEADKR